MNALATIIGKRVLRVFWSSTEQGPVTAIMFTDMDTLLITTPENILTMTYLPCQEESGDASIDALANAFGTDNQQIAYVDWNDNPDAISFNADLRSLFISLRDKAGTTEYDKSEWGRFDEMLCTLGMRQF